MAHTPSIFDRLRSMQTEGLPLHTLIVEACEVGNELTAAAQALVDAGNLNVFDGGANRAMAHAFELAAAALARAYANGDSDTPTNGARKSA